MKHLLHSLLLFLLINIFGCANDTKINPNLAGQTSSQTTSTGGWGINIGTLQVDSISLIVLLVVAGIIFYIFLKKVKEGNKLIELLVGHNLDKGISEQEKKTVQKQAEGLGLEKKLNVIVKKLKKSK